MNPLRKSFSINVLHVMVAFIKGIESLNMSATWLSKIAGFLNLVVKEFFPFNLPWTNTSARYIKN